MLLLVAVCARAEVIWEPDPSSADGQLQFMQTALRRFPFMLNRNSSYPRSALEVLGPVAGLRAELGEHAAPLTIGSAAMHTMDYTPAGQLYHDEEKLGAVRASLIAKLKRMPARDLRSLEKDLRAAKGADFKKTLRDLLPLVPFLYDGNGSPRYARLDEAAVAAITATIERATPSDFDNRYLDQLSAHNAPLIETLGAEKGLGELRLAYASLRNQFIDRQLKDACTARYRKIEGLTPRRLSIEATNPLLAILRGNFGEDCSLHSVPYLPLVKDVKVYWIRRNGDPQAEPDGYVLAMPAKVNGKTVPYIVTVNGASLGSEEARAACALVAHDWGSDSVILPDLKKNFALVNTDAMRNGLTSPRSRAVEPELPEGIHAIDEHMRKHPSRYSNYYAAKTLASAHLTTIAELRSFEPGPIASTTVNTPPPSDWSEVTPFARAVLLRRLAGDRASGEMLRKLSLTAHQFGAAGRVLDATREKPIGGKDFRTVAELGFTFADLKSLEPLTRVATLAKLHAEYPQAAPVADWSALVRETYDALVLKLERAMPKEIHLVEPLEAILALPKTLGCDARREIEALVHSNKDPALRAALIPKIGARLPPGDYYPALVRLLDDPSPGVRAQAALEMLNGKQDVSRNLTTRAKAAREILPLTKNADAQQRRRGYQAVGAATPTDRAMQVAVLDGLADWSADVREAAAAALVTMGLSEKAQVELALTGPVKPLLAEKMVKFAHQDARIIPYLLGRATDDTALNELLSHAKKLKEFDTSIIDLALATLKHEKPAFRDAAEQVLIASRSTEDRVVLALVDRMNGTDAHRFDGLAALRLPKDHWLRLARAEGKDASKERRYGMIRALQHLFRFHADVDEESTRLFAESPLPSHLLWELTNASRFTPAAVPNLLEVLGFSDNHARERAAAALGKTGVADDNVVLALVRARQDEYHGVPAKAAEALRALYVSEARQTELALAAPEPRDAQMERSILDLGWRNAKTDPRLHELTDRMLRGVRNAASQGFALQILRAHHSVDSKFIPAISVALRHGDSGLRDYALAALGRTKSADPSVYLPVIYTRGDISGGTAALAVATLRGLRISEAEQTKLVLDAPGERTPAELHAVAPFVLKHAPRDPRAIALYDRALRMNAAARGTALTALESAQGVDAAFYPALLEVLASAGRWSDERAAKLLGKSGTTDPKVIDGLIEAVAKEGDVREAAREALAKLLGGEAGIGRALLDRHATASPNALARLLPCVGPVGADDPRATLALRRALRAPDPHAIHGALRALRDHAGSFLGGAETLPDDLVRQVAGMTNKANRWLSEAAEPALAAAKVARVPEPPPPAPPAAPKCRLGWRRLYPWNWGGRGNP